MTSRKGPQQPASGFAHQSAIAARAPWEFWRRADGRLVPLGDTRRTTSSRYRTPSSALDRGCIGADRLMAAPSPGEVSCALAGSLPERVPQLTIVDYC